MNYKKKLAILAVVVVVLALVYVFSQIFNPERMNSRNSMFTWLDPKVAAGAEKITVTKDAVSVNLIKQGGVWFVLNNNIQYPAKQLRITDLINTLTARASYPVRASGADSQERLGITDDKASRITVSGSTGQPMLELLAGSFDTTGQNIFLRKSGSNDIRSGEDKFSPYLSGGLTSWYNLRLIPETQDNKLDIDKVQRLTVYTSVQDSSVQPLVLTRDKNGWTSNQGDAVALDTEKVNTYVRGVLFTEGDDFSSEYKNDDPMFNSSQIVIELGDRSASAGNIRTIKLSAAEGDKRFATVSGSASDSDFVYSIPGWAANKLFTTVDQLKAEPKPAPAPAGNAANPQPGDASAVPIPPQPAPGAPPYSH